MRINRRLSITIRGRISTTYLNFKTKSDINFPYHFFIDLGELELIIIALFSFQRFLKINIIPLNMIHTA